MNIQDTQTLGARILAGSLEGIGGIQKMLQEHYHRMKQQSPSDEIDPALYLVTTKFQNRPLGSLDESSQRRLMLKKYGTTEDNIAFAAKFNYFTYKFIRNQIVPNWNYASRSKHHPIAVSFLDFPETRDYQPHITQMPHYHSIYLIAPRTRKKFEQVVAREFDRLHLNGSNSPIIGVDSREIANPHEDLKSVLDYSSKFLRFHIAKGFSPEAQDKLFEVYGKGDKRWNKRHSK